MKPFSNRYCVAPLAGHGCTLPAGSMVASVPVLMFGAHCDTSNSATVDTLVVTGNVVLGGLIQTLSSVTTGFGGGPIVVQGSWDAPANVHVLDWATLANDSDDVTASLTVHVSSKDGTRKNGIATIMLVKNAGDALDVMVTSLYMFGALEVLDIAVDGNDIVVHTDDGCSVCWTLLGAV